MKTESRVNDKHRLILVISISVVSFLMILLMGPMIFESSGDGLFNLVAAGVFGDDNQYVLFSNILLGYLLKYLYILIPQVNWYLWILLLSELLSVTAICAAMTRGCDLISTAFISLVINFTLGWECYSDIQFTVAAMVCSAGGLLLLCTKAEERKRSVCVLGAVLYIMGFMWRKECAVMVIPFFAVWIVLRLFFGDKKPASYKTVIITFAFCGMAYLLNSYAYSGETWSYYSEHSRYRAAIIDHTPVFYIPGAYDEIGVTEAEADYFRNWYFADPDKMPMDKLKALYELQYSGGDYSMRISADVLKSTLSAVKAALKQYRLPVLYALVWLLAFIVCIFRKSFKKLLLLMLSSGMVLAFYWYFACINRIVWRVEMGIWLSALLIILTDAAGFLPRFWDHIRNKLSERSFKTIRYGFAALIIVAFGGVSVSMADYFIHVKNSRITPEYDSYRELFYEIRGDECIYLGSLSTGCLRLYNSPFGIDGAYKGLFDNYVQYGGILYWTGFNVDYLYSHGIDNPTTALFERDDVYYIAYDWEAEMLLDYLQKEYDENICLEQIDSWKDIGIWKFER